MTSTPLPQDPMATQAAPQPLSTAEVEEIYREFHQDLAAFLWGVLRDAHRSQDALQQTFQRLTENSGTIRRETIRGWLFRVAYHEALQIRRGEHRAARHHEIIGKSLTNETRSPPDQLVSTEEAARLQQALLELPPEQQVVVRRRIQQGETFAEIAASLEAPLGTILTRMRLAVQRLRKTLRDE